MTRSSELERIALLATRFGRPATGTGIGDDAAILEPGASPLVWTIDAQVEGTHFRRDWLMWNDVGWRSFMAAASDLAAMGATAIAALSALSLSDDVDDAALDELARGQADAARAVGATVVGGNLARGKETSITTTLLGSASRPIVRSGARSGDALFLGGDVGMAGAGLAALAQGPLSTDAATMACVLAWRRPSARMDLVKHMGAATAAVDISDGLARDAAHLANASDVVLVFDEDALRAHASDALRGASALLGRDPLDVMLGGGEDYALLIAIASDAAPSGFTRVGVVEEGEPAVLLARGDRRRILPPAGFDHFKAPRGAF